VVAIAANLAEVGGSDARTAPWRIGVAVCELVDLEGRVTSAQAVDWLDRDVAGALSPSGIVTVASDVRAGALAEARMGAGRSLDPFVYVSIGTGISHTLVQDGVPYPGRHGTALIASSGTISAVCPRCGEPLELVPEQVASGNGMVGRYAESGPHQRPERVEDVLAAAADGDEIAARIVDEGGAMLGTVVAGLVNVLDPQGVVVGGGLGLAPGRYRDRFLASFAAHIWAPTSRDTPVVDAALGTDAVLVGAALSVETGIGARGARS